MASSDSVKRSTDHVDSVPLSVCTTRTRSTVAAFESPLEMSYSKRVSNWSSLPSLAAMALASSTMGAISVSPRSSCSLCIWSASVSAAAASILPVTVLAWTSATAA
eukprot:Amastigsp_a176864_3.p4 type:complete len:106 gc:universal Amastigsp_a176864_3:267-584(+)